MNGYPNTEKYYADKRARESKEAVEDPGENWHDVPVCPHCGTHNDDWWDGNLSLRNDGDSTEHQCGECEKFYITTMCVETTFQTDVKP